MTTVKRILAAAAVTVWVVVPVVAAVVLTARSERSVQSPPVASAWVPVGDVETELSRLVVASGTLGDAPPLVAPAWTGLVEQVEMGDGEVLRSGDPVAVIDGVTRLAVHTPRPFRRPLGPTDRGQDVADLNGWLGAHGYEASEDDRFGSATRRGIRALRERIGLGTDVDSFDPVWFVYLARPEVTVSSVALQVGIPAPGPGTAIAELAPQVTDVELLVPSATGAPTAAPAAPPAGPSGDPAAPTSGGVPAEATTAPVPTTPAATPPAGSGSTTATAGTPLTTAAEGAVLVHTGAVVGPVAPDGSLPDETLIALLPLIGTRESTNVQLVEPVPGGVRGMPAAALFTGPTGSTCVTYRAEPDGQPTVGLVTPRAQTGDRILVGGLPDEAREAQVNPPAATRRLCQG